MIIYDSSSANLQSTTSYNYSSVRPDFIPSLSWQKRNDLEYLRAHYYESYSIRVHP
jgi:hypothetical protein